jgi:hypothetical protein
MSLSCRFVRDQIGIEALLRSRRQIPERCRRFAGEVVRAMPDASGRVPARLQRCLASPSFRLRDVHGMAGGA